MTRAPVWSGEEEDSEGGDIDIVGKMKLAIETLRKRRLIKRVNACRVSSKAFRQTVRRSMVDRPFRVHLRYKQYNLDERERHL
jgi:hypothetical protein